MRDRLTRLTLELLALASALAVAACLLMGAGGGRVDLAVTNGRPSFSATGSAVNTVDVFVITSQMHAPGTRATRSVRTFAGCRLFAFVGVGLNVRELAVPYYWVAPLPAAASAGCVAALWVRRRRRGRRTGTGFPVAPRPE